MLVEERIMTTLVLHYGRGKRIIELPSGKDEVRKILNKLWKERNEIGLRIFCACTEDPPEMTVAKTRKGYCVKTFPGQKLKHSSKCIFGGTESLAQGNEKESPVTLSLFKNQSRNKEKMEREIRDEIDYRKRRNANTFSGFIESRFIFAYNLTFNTLNKQLDRVNNQNTMRMPTIKDVKIAFYRHLNKFPCKGKDAKTVEDLIKSGKLKIYVDICIEISKIRNEYLFVILTSKGKKKVWANELTTGNFRIYLDGMVNVEPPYIMVRSIVGNKPTPDKVYLHPICFGNEEQPFIPVDSNVEWEYARELVLSGTVFYKPFDLTEIKDIKSIITSPHSRRYSYPYTPDFIVFRNGKIEVVEIFGMKNLRDYDRLKGDKKKLLGKLESPFKGVWFEK